MEQIGKGEELTVIGQRLREIVRTLKRDGVTDKQILYMTAAQQLAEEGHDLTSFDDENGPDATFMFEPETGALVRFDGILLGVERSGDEFIEADIITSKGFCLTEIDSVGNVGFPGSEIDPLTPDEFGPLPEN